MMELERLLTASLDLLLKTYPDRHIILQLSGGCDSAALFFCLQNLKKEFECHTYCVEENEDFNNTDRFCKAFDVSLVIHKLSIPEVISNISFLKGKYHFKGKVNLQCIACHYKIALNVKGSVIINGSYADILYGSYASIVVPYSHNDNLFREERRRLLQRNNIDATDYLRTIMKENNNDIIFPFCNPELYDFFLNLNYEELKNKSIFYETFRNRIPEGINLKRKSQQIGSGVRDKLKNKGIKYK